MTTYSNFINLLATVLIGTIIVACGPQKPKGGYQLDVEIKNYEFPTVLKLKGKGEAPDTIQVKQGKFTLVGKLEQPEKMNFQSAEPDSWDMVSLWIDNNEIQMMVDFSKEYNDENRIVIVGSKAQELANQYEEDRKHAIQKYDGAYGRATTEYLMGQIGYRAERHADHPVTLYELSGACFGLNTGSAPIKVLEKYLTILSPAFKDTDEYKRIKTTADFAKKRVLGTPFIDYVAKDPKGNDFKLADMLGKSYVFVDCWASWCGPCRAENPHVKKALKLYKDKGFQVLSISFDSKPEPWKKAINDDRLFQFAHASELNHYDNLVAKAYGINGIPDNFLLDKDGNIVENNLRGEELLEFLEALYEQI